MFQDVCVGVVRFKSKADAQTRDAGCTTAVVAVSEHEAQTEGARAEGSTQTDAKTSSSSGKKGTSTSISDEERQACSAFLDRVGPMVLRELAKNRNNRANYSGLERYLEAREESNVAKLFTLRFDYDAYFQSSQTAATAAATASSTSGASTTSYRRASTGDVSTAVSLKLSCTGLSWNATGAVLGVAFGRLDHTGWCDYRSALCLWNVFQADFNAAKPHTVLETSSGLMCVAFHPKNPSLVAGGTFNGEVLVWDLEPEEYRFWASGIGDYFHREPVTQVAWVYDPQANDYNIASVSGDGKVLFWRLKDKLAYPVEGYVLHLPTSGGNPANSSSASSTSSTTATTTATTTLPPPTIGGKSLAFSPTDKTSRSFMVGSDGGAVVRCFCRGSARASDFKGDKKWTATAARLVGKLPPPRLASVRRQVELYATHHKVRDISLATVYDAQIEPRVLFPSAMDFVLAPHGGPVYALAFSPFRKSAFLSCSSDGTARLYSYLHKDPLLSLEVAPTASYLYDIAWSRTRPLVLAIAAEDGHVYVYDLKADRVSPVLTLSGRDVANPSASSSSSSASSRSRRSSASKAASSSSNASASTSSSGNTVGGHATTPSAMLALDFNPRQRNFLAAGDASGAVHIWKLPWQLANLQAGELSLLEAMEDDEALGA